MAAISPLAYGQSKPRTVAQIEIVGLKTIPEAEVRALLETKEWGPYDETVVARDLGRLLADPRFSEARIVLVPLSEEAMRLDVTLVESGLPAAPAPVQPPLAPAATAQASAPEEAPAELPSPPWVIGELEVRGNRHVKASVIRGQIKGRKGDLYDRPDLDRDIQNILNLGGFERVAADISVLKDRPVPEHYRGVSPSSFTVRVAFLVEEKPLVRKIEFRGNKRMGKGRLREETTLRAKDPFDRFKLREDTDKLLEFYRKKGFHRVAVEPKVSVDTAAQQVEIAYDIEEGPKARIAAVIITGAKSFKPKKIARQMKNRRKKVFDEKQFEEDLKKVEEFYKNRGYLDFQIESSSVTYNDALTEITIRLELEEGPQYRFGDTTFGGHTVYVSSALANVLEYRRGKIFSQERFENSVRAIQELYAEVGRLQTPVIPERVYNSTTGLMDVHMEIREGPVFYVDHVDVEGNKATKTHVIRREIVIKPGEPFSLSRMRKSAERVMNLGFMDDVTPDVQPTADPEKVDLVFTVLEGKPGALTAGAGFSSLDGLIGTLSLQHMNLFGRAQRASVQWAFGSRVQDYSLSWTTPWVANRPMSLGFDVFNTRRLSPFDNSVTAFTNKRTGGSVRLGPRFQNDKYQLSFSYTFQRITIGGVEQQFLGRLQQGTSDQSSFGVEAARDTRDNFWDPSRGTRNSIGFTLAGGPLQGNVNFFKPFMANSMHKTLARINEWPLVLSFSNRLGYVTQFGESNEVPVYERFFIGGQDTLRGYNIDGEVGPPDGGRVYDVFNVELGFPLARERRRTIVKFVTFFDAGGNWQNVRDMRLQVGPGVNDIKTNVGFGIRFTTPAFPIRLDWGYGFNHRPGEQKYQINFGIGNLF